MIQLTHQRHFAGFGNSKYDRVRVRAFISSYLSNIDINDHDDDDVETAWNHATAYNMKCEKSFQSSSWCRRELSWDQREKVFLSFFVVTTWLQACICYWTWHSPQFSSLSLTISSDPIVRCVSFHTFDRNGELKSSNASSIRRIWQVDTC